MSLPEKGAPPPPKKERRTVTITLSIPAALTGVLALFLGCVWIFFLGILLGRGHTPEARIPEIERLMPKPRPADAPQLVSGTDAPARAAQTPPQGGAASGGTSPDPPREAERPRNQIMSQEDLSFPGDLRPGTARPRGRDAARAEAGRQPPPAQAGNSARQGEEAQVFLYVYQVAAYKDAASSDRQAAKLKAAGFKARTEKSLQGSTDWYKTMVDFRGTPDETDELRAGLKKQGISRVILRSKTPARR